MRIVVLGAGFGGLELTSRLSEQFGDDLDLVLIDKNEGFVFGFSKLDVMFGRQTADGVLQRYHDVVKPGVRFVNSEVMSVDPVAKSVKTSDGDFEADILVIALGADLDPAATPGLVQGGHEFYSVPGAVALREVFASFDGGKVVIGVTSTPFKCPPAPSEMALLVHQLLARKDRLEESEISLVMPMGVPLPPSPLASQAILDAFARRGITWHPDALVTGLDAARRVALLSDGGELAYDLFLGVPVHKAPAALDSSKLLNDGWIPVNPLTLETRFPGVYAIGDVTSVGTPKAGVFAEGQASVVAAAIAGELLGQKSLTTYDGHGVCYMEFGADMVATIDVTFESGKQPVGYMEGPSKEMVADKLGFASDRIARWFS